MKTIIVIFVIASCLLVGSVLAAEHNFRKRFAFLSHITDLSSFTSSSEGNKALPLLSAKGFDCGSGASQKFPVENDRCTAVDENEKRSARNACEYYVECNSDLCRWLKRRCDAGKAWHEDTQKCVPLLQADCAPSMFGEKAKLMIMNHKYNRTYLSECQNCPDSEPISGPTSTSVVGLRGNPEKPQWYQTIVTRQREHNAYYSLAFDRVDGSEFKVIDGYQTGVPISRLYDEDKWEGTGWRFVPVPSEEEEDNYLLVCKTTGKALEMTGDVDENNNFKIKLAKPDLANQGQMWTIHQLKNGLKKTRSLHSSTPSLPSSTSSEEVFRVAGLRLSSSRLRTDAQCPSGGPSYDPSKNKYPKEDEKCYSEDLNHREAYHEDCQQYVHCDTSECLWRVDECDAAHYWNNIKGECVDAADADCGGALFYREAEVQIENVVFGAVLDDCRDCGWPEDRDWEKQTPVIGFKKNASQPWNQVLVAKRRDNSTYYSLAFRRGDGLQVKVVTDLGNEKVASKIFKVASPELTQWRFVPIPLKKDKIRIISVYSGKALTMGRIEGAAEYKIRVAKIDTEDRKQEWIVRGLDGTPLSF